MKSMFPDTEPEYMAWAVHGYMYDFGLSREDAITTAKKDWAEHCKVRAMNLADQDDEPEKKRVKHNIPVTGYRKRPVKRPKVKDHRGVEFKSVKEMCERWGISKSCFLLRMRHCYTLERALTEKQNYTPAARSVSDHQGHSFKSIKAMCDFYGIAFETFDSRKRHGWSLQQALETPVGKKFNHQAIKDHLGHEFLSLKEMCAAWKIPYQTFNRRRKLGLSVKDALTLSIQ